jgi:hypothetical protein
LSGECRNFREAAEESQKLADKFGVVYITAANSLRRGNQSERVLTIH